MSYDLFDKLIVVRKSSKKSEKSIKSRDANTKKTRFKFVVKSYKRTQVYMYLFSLDSSRVSNG